MTSNTSRNKLVHPCMNISARWNPGVDRWGLWNCVLLDISKFPSLEMAQVFTPIRTVKDSFLSLRPHRQRVSSSVWMFANQISKKWYLGVVLLYISLTVVVGWNIFSEYLEDDVYFLCCELNVQLSVSLFYYLFQRFYFECICICDCFSVFQCIDFCLYFIFLPFAFLSI